MPTTISCTNSAANRRSPWKKLHQRLLSDRDPRTQNCLRTMRQLYDRLKEKVDSGKVTPAAYGVIEGVDKLFRSCVKQLEDSVDLWEMAQTIKGSARKSMLRQREQLVTEVCEAVEQLGQTVERFHEVETGRDRTELVPDPQGAGGIHAHAHARSNGARPS